MDFSRQLEEHRKKASEDWARDQFFQTLGDRRPRKKSFSYNFAKLMRKMFSTWTLFFCLIFGFILWWGGWAVWGGLWAVIAVLGGLSLLRVLLSFISKQKIVELIDHSGASLVGQPSDKIV